MDHVAVTLVIAIACFVGGVAMYFLFLKPAEAKLGLATLILEREKSRIGSEAFATYEQEIDPDYNETHHFISNLIQQGRSGVVQVDIDGALGDTSNRLSGLIVWPRFYAQLAVYIGLLGTIFGLWLALGNLQGATQIHDESTLRAFASSTRDLLGSLQGAFFSALAGVLVTTLLGWRVQHFDRASDRYVEELDRFARQKLLSKLEGLRLELLPQSGLEAAQLIVTQLDKTLVSFTRSWAERFKTLAEETTRLAESGEGFRESTKALEASADTLAEVTAKLDGKLEDVVGATRAVVESTSRNGEIIATASLAVTELSRRAEQWPDISAQLQQTGSQVAVASDSMRLSTDQLAASTTGFGQAWSGLSDDVRKLSAESFKELNETFLLAVEEIVRKATTELTGVVAGVHERDAELTKLANKVGLAVEQQATYSAKLADTVYRMYGLIPALEDPRPALETILSSLRSVSEAIRSQGERLAGPSAPPIGSQDEPHVFVGALAGIQTRLEGVGTTLQSSQSVAQSTNQKLDRIATLLENLISTEANRHTGAGANGQPKKWWKVGG